MSAIHRLVNLLEINSLGTQCVMDVRSNHQRQTYEEARSFCSS
jgi:hypothetical protein